MKTRERLGRDLTLFDLPWRCGVTKDVWNRLLSERLVLQLERVAVMETPKVVEKEEQIERVSEVDGLLDRLREESSVCSEGPGRVGVWLVERWWVQQVHIVERGVQCV